MPRQEQFFDVSNQINHLFIGMVPKQTYQLNHFCYERYHLDAEG